MNLTLLPNPMAESLKREPKSSPMRLLAGVVYYQIRKHFGGGCTQMLVVNNFDLKSKNVAVCITGRKYLGSKDKQASTKHKTAEDTPQETKRMCKKRMTMMKIRKHTKFTSQTNRKVS